MPLPCESVFKNQKLQNCDEIDFVVCFVVCNRMVKRINIQLYLVTLPLLWSRITVYLT